MPGNKVIRAEPLLRRVRQERRERASRIIDRSVIGDKLREMDVKKHQHLLVLPRQQHVRLPGQLHDLLIGQFADIASQVVHVDAREVGLPFLEEQIEFFELGEAQFGGLLLSLPVKVDARLPIVEKACYEDSAKR